MRLWRADGCSVPLDRPPSPLFAAETQQLTGLSTSAFSDMAQWRGDASAGEPHLYIPPSLLAATGFCR